MPAHHDNVKKSNRKQQEFPPSFIELLESRQLLSGTAGDPIVAPSVLLSSAAASTTSVKGYSPAQIKAAYGITGTGSGQTIAIVDAYSDPNIAADLAVFDKQFGLSAPPSFKQVSATGSTTNLPAANAGWDTEIALDVEWAHAIAPQANIVLVDAASASLSSLMGAVNYARNLAGVSVISMSWGTNEFYGETSYDSYFTTPAGHTGITFVAASGDEGASGGAEWPAVSSNVLSVGGTTLTLSSTGAIASETAWSDSSGGTSSFETLPVQSSATGLRTRSSPDVSYDANPATGFAVYDSVPYEGYVGWQEVGGTSAGAPQWAAIIAIADSARVAAKSTTLTTAQTLADVYSIYSNATNYSNDFHDITSGTSLLSIGSGGPFGFGGFGFWGPPRATYVSATTGYDTLTGIGTPKGAGLIAALTSGTTATATTSTPASVATTKSTSSATRNAELLNVNETTTLLAFQNLDTNAVSPSVTVSAPDLPPIDVVTAAGARAISPDIMSTGGLPGAQSALHEVGNSIIGVSSINAGTDAGSSTAPAGQIHGLIDSLFAPSPLDNPPNVYALPAAVPPPITTLAPQAGQALRDMAHDFKNELSALSPNLGDIKSDSGGLVIALAIANALLLGYCYSNRNRNKIASHEAVFNDGKPIDFANSPD